MIRFILLTALFCSPAVAAEIVETVRDGDVIFQTSRSSQSIAVQRATKSPFSHMGIIFHRGGQPLVLEAAATVRFTPLAEWIARGVDGSYFVKRLSDASTRLNASAISQLTTQAKRLHGKPYDYAFQWTDDRIYCSELVWKLYQRALKIELGSLQRLEDFDLSDPVVAAKVRERYGEHVPLSERVISPVAIFESPELTTVAK